MPPYQNQEQDRRLTSLEEKFNTLCSNYNEEIGSVRVNIATITATQKVQTGVMVIILTAIIGLFLK